MRFKAGPLWSTRGSEGITPLRMLLAGGFLLIDFFSLKHTLVLLETVQLDSFGLESDYLCSNRKLLFWFLSLNDKETAHVMNCHVGGDS